MKGIQTIVWGIVLLFAIPVWSQVGIGTVTPNAQLDIRSSNQATPSNTDGILIPKVDDYPLTPPTAAQDGMLIYATGVGSVAQGFYYWDNGTTNWISLSGASVSDHDWYEETTTTAPNDISDNMFTQGEVGIGTITPSYALDIAENSHDRGINLAYFRTSPTVDIAGIYSETNDANPGNTSRGFYNYVRGSDGNKEGIYNRIEPTGAGTHIGTRNQISGNASGAFIGVNNVMNSGTTTATQTGLRNQILASGVQQIGLDSDFQNGTDSYGVRNSFGTSTAGDKYGISNSFSGGSPGIHYGLYNSFSGASNGARNASYTIMSGTGTGSQVGHRVDINMNNITFAMGFGSVISGSANAILYGSDMLISNTGTGAHYGTRNRLSGTGTGIHYGTYNQLSGTGNGIQYGTYQDISTNGTQDQFGSYNGLVNNSQGSRYGSYSLITGSDPAGMGTKTGSYNRINISGNDSGNHYGTYNILEGDGIGIQYGSFQSLGTTGGNEQYGSYSEVVSAGATSHYGTYNSMTHNGTGTNFGAYNYLSGTGDGLQYGSFQELVSDGIQNQFGSVNSLSNNSTGTRTGTRNILAGFDTAGIGEKYGTQTTISIAGDATHYGNYNLLTGSGGGDKYGVFADVTGATGGTHYGLYASANIASGYAGFFNGNMQMDNGRASFTDASLDAGPTTGTGILELGGNLRMDANEIITNTGSTLFLQHDNGGNLRVDNTSLFVNGTTNRVGIGTVTPGYTLDVVGDINTSGNIRQGGGAAYNYPDYVFESYFDGMSPYNPNYTLRSLSEIEEYLKSNKHLPGIQSRADIAKDGWNVSEGVRGNLEKIEELYLHLIEVNKQNNQLIKENELLKKRLERLERAVFN